MNTKICKIIYYFAHITKQKKKKKKIRKVSHKWMDIGAAICPGGQFHETLTLLLS